MPSKEFVAEWIRLATNDLISARHLFEELYPKQTEIAVWHSHQCAEKMLKAFLVANDIEPTKIHNLDKLVKLCQDIDSGFAEIEIDCANQNPFGSVSRYPNELVIDEVIAQAAIDRTQKIYDFCAARAERL